MKKTIIFLSSVLICALLSFDFNQSEPNCNKATALYDVLLDLGEDKPKHYIKPNKQLVRTGEQLVKKGWATTPEGKRGKPISKYYLCTTCHNLEREDPDLRKADPVARLPYVKKAGIPFVQGSPFWGIVNRESWYNDDYVNKYGDEKIEIAHKDLRESIQLCAIECSQGRPMDDWEIEAVLAYYWSLEYKMSDLDLNEKDWQKLKTESQDPNNHASLRKWLKTFYLQTSPATFYDAPKDKRVGYPNTEKGDPRSGKDLYDLSCIWCHNPENGVSHYILDDSRKSFQHLNRMMFKDSHFSLYQIVAYGTYSIPGHRPYMPHYPKEKMNEQQVEDLRAYIKMRAKGEKLETTKNSKK